MGFSGQIRSGKHTQIAIENGHLHISILDFPMKWLFSTAMLNFQRVSLKQNPMSDCFWRSLWQIRMFCIQPCVLQGDRLKRAPVTSVRGLTSVPYPIDRISGWELSLEATIWRHELGENLVSSFYILFVVCSIHPVPNSSYFDLQSTSLDILDPHDSIVATAGYW